MALNDEQWMELLDAALARGGVLKVITNEVKPELRQDANDPQSPANEGVDLQDPASWVQHDVVAIKPHPAREHHLVAYTAEGDECESYDGPSALAVRLMEWRWFDPNNRAATHTNVARMAEMMYEALPRNQA